LFFQFHCYRYLNDLLQNSAYLLSSLHCSSRIKYMDLNQ
jgi:hypothetical protein